MNTSSSAIEPIPVCDYEGSSYRTEFWSPARRYEDNVERIALRKLLPPAGRRLAEIGAGFGRLADLYTGYEQVILLDYAQSLLKDAQQRLGRGGRFIYVAADLYRLPLAHATLDTVVTVRVLHHVRELQRAFAEIARAIRPGGTYVLEYANKRNLKAILRWLLRRQPDNPFSTDPYEFVPLNFDFHPVYIEKLLAEAGFQLRDRLAVSTFRFAPLKKVVPTWLLVAADNLLQSPMAPLSLSPSIFLRMEDGRTGSYPQPHCLWRCPRCGNEDMCEQAEAVDCPACDSHWPIEDGVYLFK